MSESITAYPLTYPTGWARTPKSQIIQSRFGKAGWTRTPPSTWQGVQAVNHELELLGAREVIISSNLKLRNDGLPASSQRNPEDAGAAVYFQLNKKPRVLACDKWATVGENLWAIAKHIDALRGQERWGVGTLDQAFTGYAQLEAETGQHWTSILGLTLNATPEDVKEKFLQFAKQYHPDAGGDPEQFKKVSLARDAALKQLNGHSK